MATAIAPATRWVKMELQVEGKTKHSMFQMEKTATIKAAKSRAAQAFNISEESIKEFVWMRKPIEANDDDVLENKVKEVYCREHSLDPSKITPDMVFQNSYSSAHFFVIRNT